MSSIFGFVLEVTHLFWVKIEKLINVPGSEPLFFGLNETCHREFIKPKLQDTAT